MAMETRPRQPLDAGTDCDDNDGGAYPGVAYNEPSLCTVDRDTDGWGDENAAAPLDAGLDCDDSSAALNEDDLDQDSYSTCDADCDDNDSTAYPGVAANEPVCTVDGMGRLGRRKCTHLWTWLGLRRLKKCSVE